MNLPRFLAACLALGLSAACTSARQSGAPSATPADEHAAAERELRRMFPSIEGPITREAIAARLAEETERERAARDASAPLRAGAIEAIEQGDFDRARDLLSELLAGHHVERARTLAEAGDSKGALAALDRALEMAPRSASILCARGEAAFAAGAHDPALLESALANFLAAAALAPENKASARAWLGASRTARVLGHVPEAREYALRGLASSELARAPADALQRSLAEATFDEYLGAKSAGAAAETIRSRAVESQDALEGLLGRVPEDPWSWAHLAELAESSGAHAQAREIALRGLRIAPDDASLLESLARAARGAGGAGAAVAALDPYTRRHPEVAAGVWQLALALYDQGIEDSAHARDPAQHLADAETAFARCRGLDAREESRCRALEAQCRGARASWLLAHGDIDGAHRAFVSM
jgi:tetratricopeptide (TPR) repeat protein